MKNYLKMGIAADLEEAMDYIKQMISAILEGDVKGAEHFMDRINACLSQIEDDLAETHNEFVMDEA